MAEQDSKNPVAIITAVVAIFGASWWLQSTPTSSRPRLSGSAPQVLSSAQDIPARLWQDPVRLTLEHYNQALWSPNKEVSLEIRPKQRLEELRKWLNPTEESTANDAKTAGQANANEVKAAQTPNDSAAKSPKTRDAPDPSYGTPGKSLVLIAMIPGGSAPERSELRLRVRQAVIYALGSELYRPWQGDNIGYFKLSVPLDRTVTPTTEPKAPIQDSTVSMNLTSERKAEEPQPPKSGNLLIPFERFALPLPQPAADSRSMIDDHPKLNRICDKVSVLWLCDDLPGATAYKLLWETANAVGCVRGDGKIDPNFVLRILGPSSSEVLQELWSEGGKIQNKAEHELSKEERFLKEITITSPFATVDAAAIQAFRLGRGNQLSIPRVERTVHDDYVVCSELVSELARRNVIIYGSGSAGPDPGQNRTWHTGHIALLSEWDTFYGRVLPFTFRRALANHPTIFADKRATEEGAGGPDPVQIAGDAVKQYQSLLDNQVWPKGLESFVYLRGLDGRPPTEDRQRAPSGPLPPGATSAERLATEGESQADFVERLAGQLARRHDQLIREGRGGFRAIGVLGSDVYDKLMLLRALRRQFRGVVFFTNDLDARFALPEETQACRNLVIASGYGLNLKADYQHTIPQFRSSTQTAVFAAMLHLLGGVDVATTADPLQSANKPRPKDLGTVRLFEIGLRGAVDLTIPKFAENWPLAGKSGGLLHPERLAVRGPFEGVRAHRTALLQMGILGTILCATLFVGFYNSELARVTIETKGKPPRTEDPATKDAPEGKPDQEAPGGPSTGKPDAGAEDSAEGRSEKAAKVIRLLGRRWLGFIVPLVVSFSCYCWFLAHAQPEGEPFTLLDGTSSWQTFAVMTFAALFCVHLICRTELILHENDQSLANEYRLNNPPPEGWASEKYFRPFAEWHERMARALEYFGQQKLAEKVAGRNQFDQILDLILMRWRGTSTKLNSDEELVSANRLWLRYQFLGQFGYRVLRAFLLTAIAFTGIWIAFQFSPPPPLPFRSPDGPPLVAITAAFGTFLFSTLLLFVVSDAVILSCGLIRRLDRGRTYWPGSGQRSPVPSSEQNPASDEDAARITTEIQCRIWRDRMLAERSDISFIEKRTRAVGRITHYPFFMVALIFVARNRYFDDWAMPLGVIITYVLLLVTTIALSCWLNSSARSARDGSLLRLENLKNEIDNYGFANLSQRPLLADLFGQLNEVRDEIKGMREGSYAPFWDQPAFRGILLGTGGWSLSTLLPQLSYLI